MNLKGFNIVSIGAMAENELHLSDSEKLKVGAILGLAREKAEKEALIDCKLKYLAQSDSTLRDFIYLDLLGLGNKSTTTKQEYKMENLGDKLSNIESVLTDHRNYLNHVVKEQKEVQEKITAFENEAEKIKLQIKERDKAGRFIPKYGEIYYFLNRSDGIGSVRAIDFNDDQPRRDLGNCYKTENEALAAIKRQKAIVRVNDAIDKVNDGWVPDFDKNTGSCNKYCIATIMEGGSTVVIQNITVRYNAYPLLKYCKSGEKLHEIIKNHLDDLKLIFGIKE